LKVAANSDSIAVIAGKCRSIWHIDGSVSWVWKTTFPTTPRFLALAMSGSAGRRSPAGIRAGRGYAGINVLMLWGTVASGYVTPFGTAFPLGA